MSALKRTALRALRALAIFVGMIALFIVLMTLVYSLPQDGIIANAGKSAAVLCGEGSPARPIIDDLAYVLDNATDALMIDTAIREPSDSALTAAVANVHEGAVTSEGRADTLQGLADTVAGGRQAPVRYAYYWHGYQVALRPALMILDYTQLRYLNVLALTALGWIVALGLQRDAGGIAATAFVFALAVCGYAVVPMALQYANMTYLMLAATLVLIAMLRAGTFQHMNLEFFLVVGMLTSFFDLLTTPLLTLCIPLAVLLIITSKSVKHPLRAHLAEIVKLAAMWCVGYAGAWVSKWVLASAVLHRDYVAIAVKQVLFRTGMDGRSVGPVEALVRNVARLTPPGQGAWPSLGAAESVGLALGILAVALLVRYRRPRTEIARAFVPMLLVPAPYVWFVVASNHSAIHSWFTYRIQLVSVFVVIYLLLSIPDMDRVRRAYSPLLVWRRAASAEAQEPSPMEGRSHGIK